MNSKITVFAVAKPMPPCLSVLFVSKGQFNNPVSVFRDDTGASPRVLQEFTHQMLRNASTYDAYALEGSVICLLHARWRG